MLADGFRLPQSYETGIKCGGRNISLERTVRLHRPLKLSLNDLFQRVEQVLNLAADVAHRDGTAGVVGDDDGKS